MAPLKKEDLLKRGNYDTFVKKFLGVEGKENKFLTKEGIFLPIALVLEINGKQYAYETNEKRIVKEIISRVEEAASVKGTKSSIELLEQGGIKFIKGNASEIIALSGKQLDSSKGVENTSTLSPAITAGKTLAEKYNICIIITGKQDTIISSQKIEHFTFGHSMMTKVTGIGCLLNAVIATFATLSLDSFQAAKQATLFFAICGQEAAKYSVPLALQPDTWQADVPFG